VTRRHQSSIAVREELGAQARLSKTRIDPSLTAPASYELSTWTDSSLSFGAAEIRTGRGERPHSGKNRQPSAGSRGRNKKSAQNLATERKYVSILRADLHRSSDLVTGLGLEEAIARLAPALEQMRVGQDHLGDEGRCYSKAIKVNPGDTITGWIKGGRDATGKFNYTCSLDLDGQPQADTILPLVDIPEPVYAVCAVESYGITVKPPNPDYPADPITSPRSTCRCKTIR
jgi:hypothetical protein